jgi:hypothetical protein
MIRNVYPGSGFFPSRIPGSKEALDFGMILRMTFYVFSSPNSCSHTIIVTRGHFENEFQTSVSNQ